MTYTPEGEAEPPQVRRLRQMVMVLIVVLILGFVAMVGTIVIRLGVKGGAEAVTAENLRLPDGAEIVATGQGPGTLHVVVRQDGSELLIVFDKDTGEELSRTRIERSQGAS